MGLLAKAYIREDRSEITVDKHGYLAIDSANKLIRAGFHKLCNVTILYVVTM